MGRQSCRHPISASCFGRLCRLRCGMAFPPVMLWSTATDSCVLRNIDGQLEVLLCHDERTIRLHTCDSESTARQLAGS